MWVRQFNIARLPASRITTYIHGEIDLHIIRIVAIDVLISNMYSQFTLEHMQLVINYIISTYVTGQAWPCPLYDLTYIFDY